MVNECLMHALALTASLSISRDDGEGSAHTATLSAASARFGLRARLARLFEREKFDRRSLRRCKCKRVPVGRPDTAARIRLAPGPRVGCAVDAVSIARPSLARTTSSVAAERPFVSHA